jgi:hypothetical protein
VPFPAQAYDPRAEPSWNPQVGVAEHCRHF